MAIVLQPFVDQVKAFEPKHKIVKQNLEEMFRERRSTLLILPAISRQVLEFVRRFPGCMLGGGAALALYTGDTHKKDWDLFFTGPQFREACQELKGMGFETTSKSAWSITMEKSGVIVQVITKYFPRSVDKLFSKFDFTVCCFAVQGNDILYTKQAAEDVASGELNLVNPDNIITTIKRIARYGQKGFMPTSQCVKDLLATCDCIPEDGELSS